MSCSLRLQTSASALTWEALACKFHAVYPSRTGGFLGRASFVGVSILSVSRGLGRSLQDEHEEAEPSEVTWESLLPTTKIVGAAAGGFLARGGLVGVSVLSVSRGLGGVGTSASEIVNTEESALVWGTLEPCVEEKVVPKPNVFLGVPPGAAGPPNPDVVDIIDFFPLRTQCATPVRRSRVSFDIKEIEERARLRVAGVVVTDNPVGTLLVGVAIGAFAVVAWNAVKGGHKTGRGRK